MLQENSSMQSLEARNGKYRIVFRFGGQKYSRTLRTRRDYEAQSALARLNDNLLRAELGTLYVPEDVDIPTFLLSDGQRQRPVEAPVVRTLKQLCDAYFDSIPADSVEASTIKGMEAHARNLQRILGKHFCFHTLTLEDLQRYVAERSKDDGLRGRTVTGTTIKKDIVTLTSLWNWAIQVGILNRTFPKRGLKYPKTTDKPRFQTIAEIEHRIRRGGLSPAQEFDLWDCAFLTRPEIDEILAHVKANARYTFLYPMFAFAAHTGARRSEIVRSLIDDIDVETKTITIREKKRVRGRLSTRSVPMSPLVFAVMNSWLAGHPGGNFTFCLPAAVVRSKTERTDATPITRDEAHDHFKRTLAGSKWARLRGWHIFRHSFCSNCAAAGVDQRIINAWVGHQTEEMVRLGAFLVGLRREFFLLADGPRLLRRFAGPQLHDTRLLGAAAAPGCAQKNRENRNVSLHRRPPSSTAISFGECRRHFDKAVQFVRTRLTGHVTLRQPA